MTKKFIEGRIDSVSRIIAAAPSTLFQAFMSPDAFIEWMPPKEMAGELDYFEPKVGGGYRMTLTYEQAHTLPGKTSTDSDTVEATFVEILPDKKIAGTAVFETEDPDVWGEMLMTWYFEEVDEGTKVTIIVENVPKGIPKPDHIDGLNSTLDNLEEFIRLI